MQVEVLGSWKARVQSSVKKWVAWDQSRQKRVFHRLVHFWNVPLLAMGFLLGRATILESVSPFSVAYLAVLFLFSRKAWPGVMAMTILGAATLDTVHAAKVTGFLLLLFISYRIAAAMGKGNLGQIPFLVLFTNIVGHLAMILWQPHTHYQMLLAGIDTLLSFILTYIFVQSVPIFTKKKRRIHLRHEEIVCLVILIGSVLTGTLGFTVGDLSILHILSRYLILVLAFVGGGMIGSAMGVVTGIIMNLSHSKAILEISLLAFAGLLAGLFQEGKRIGVAIGFLLGSSVLALYDPTGSDFWLSLQESVLAIVLFFLTPSVLFQSVGRFIPGTVDNQTAHQEYVRRLRDVTAQRVEKFQDLFQELATSFRDDTTKRRQEEEDQVHQFVNEVMEKSCMGCRRFGQCWEQNVMRTYSGVTNLMALIETEGASRPISIPESWTDHCIRPEKVMENLQGQYLYHEQSNYWREKMLDSRQLVYDQLKGMADVMDKLSHEIRHETSVMSAQEEQIEEALSQLGVSIRRVDILSLEEGKVEIEILMPHGDQLEESKKLIAPLLSEVVGEPISVFRKVLQEGSGHALVTLGSAQKYLIKTGVASAAKGGGIVSGDSYCHMSLGTGKYALALSDGMGNGQRAQEESNAALKLLRRLLLAGMQEERAVETVNSILSMRTVDEVFATIDLAMVDCNSANGRFLKIGSSPGFIKRGKKVIRLAASNPPIGILKDIQVDPLQMQLQPGDLLLLMTDGIYDAAPAAMNKDTFITQMIQEIESKDPQDFADCLLEKVIRFQKGKILDDMTILVSKVERFSSEWSTIRLPGVERLERTAEA
ncbi:stage II sporulation protein E [Risungbinella massiliensis]|uniref:stage II sporulation protein E n=1 Tax=Risungbinella massiliensis TaxID=1329796 RepID=UPI0005CC59CA|nr:stage II sporulation protein E [Risungbinella massiliensis]